jgi:hypothetical protein
MTMAEDKQEMKRVRYGELEHWLGRYYGEMITNAGGLRALGTDEDILQALDMAAYSNRINLAVNELKQAPE